MRFFTKIFLLTVFIVANLVSSSIVKAEHIVGGELSYKCMGGNDYEISLVLYRDCNSPGALYDATASLFLRNQNGQYLPSPLASDPEIFRIPIELDPADTLLIPIENPTICDGTLPDLCVSKGTYKTLINLPPISGGYDLVYQRCCRNATISNITFPAETGATYVIHIPTDETECNNSSPVFNDFPPIVICDESPFTFDHSATDLDGDSLVYELYHPFNGANIYYPGNPIFSTSTGEFLGPYFQDCNNELSPEFNTPCAAQPLEYIAGFSAENPLGNPADPLVIHPESGLLKCIPNGLGQFVVGVAVLEYRNGVLLSRKVRDFEFNVKPCIQVAAIPDEDAEEILVDHFKKILCSGKTVNFKNSSFGATTYAWDFGVSGDEDTSSLESPIYEYPELGTYNVQLISRKNFTCVDTAFLELEIKEADEPFVDAGSAFSIMEGESVELNGSSGTDVFEWYPPTWLSDPTVLNPTANPEETIEYTLRAYSEEGCLSKSSITIEVEEIEVFSPGFGSLSVLDIALFPNPAGRQLQINLKQQLEEPVGIKIFDVNGRIVLELRSVQLPRQVQLPLLVDGMYYIQVRNQKHLWREKLIISNE